MAKLVAAGQYGQIELNQVAFRRDGRIEAQCALDGSQFSASVPAENGMLLAVDNVKRQIHLPTSTYSNLPIALHYSTEHMYDERKPGLKNFALYPENNSLGMESYVYPRLGYLAVGDKFTTNCVTYETTDFADEDALKAAIGESYAFGPGQAGTAPVYGGISDTGYIALTKDVEDITAGPVLQARWVTTMPDGQIAIAFICIKD